ncbi:MAG: ATP-dependent helicase, partial [Anaerolineaceae bacterium]
MFEPRACQQNVLDYTTGKMGVSAVPGSGKTQTLSFLASQIISQGLIRDDQQILVVTLVNSAVTNFSRRVDSFVEEYGLMPRMGYRVRTLHGLAHDIVRERPALVGLANDFEIVDERITDQILDSIVNSWLAEHPTLLEEYLDPMLVMDDHTTRKVSENWHQDIRKVTQAFIKQAKDLELTPADIHRMLDDSNTYFPLVEMGWSIYSDYQRALNNRCAVDFDDLIRLALQSIQSDPDYLAILQDRFPYILEDESQDSSRLQEKILRCLVGDHGNWVRVGDPNQAIYETFTTASPMYLRNFLAEHGVRSVDLPVSGRSTKSIITLANALIDWTRSNHPNPALRDSLVLPHIMPTGEKDPQPNPPDQPENIYWYDRKFSPAEELTVIADSLKRWLPEHPDSTVAVLVPRNDRGADLVDELKKRSIPYVEILRSTQSTREAAGALAHVVRFLANPLKPSLLAMVYQVWRRDDRSDEAKQDTIKKIAQTMQHCPQIEDYLFPRPEMDWLETLRDTLPLEWIEELIE